MTKDLRRGRPNGHKRIIHPCSVCGVERWVEARDLKRTDNICVHCSPKIRLGRKTKTPELNYLYQTWIGIKDRCYNKNNNHYKSYGGRGISVSKEWMSFEKFKEDMGHRPSGCSIDRVDNDGPYSKENCRWATSEQQMNNQRKTVIIHANDQRYTLSDLVNISGLRRPVLYGRLIYNKWDFERAMSTPQREYRKCRSSNG